MSTSTGHADGPARGGGDSPRLSAIILCGGRSERFGEDKALVRLAGRTFLERVIDAARALTSDIVLATGSASRYAEFGWPVVLDAASPLPPPARLPGPLAGIAAGLEAVRGDVVFLLAVDLPLVTPHALQQMFDALADYEAVIPESDGHLQPLCSVMRAAPARAAVTRLLAASRAAPRELAGELRTFRLLVGRPESGDPLARALFNVNSVEDLQKAEEKFTAG